jgi:hypothetical protein
LGNRQYPGYFAGPKSATELRKPPIGPASVIVDGDRRVTHTRPPWPPQPADPGADHEEESDDPPLSRSEAALRAATAPLAAARALTSQWASRAGRLRGAGYAPDIQTAVARYETAVRDAERAARVINDVAATTPFGLQTAAALRELLEVCDRFNSTYRAALESLGQQSQQRGPLLSPQGEVLAPSVIRRGLERQLTMTRRAAAAQRDLVAMDFLTDATELLHNDQLAAAAAQLITAQERLTAGLEAADILATAASHDAPIEQVQSPSSDSTEEKPDDRPS